MSLGEVDTEKYPQLVKGFVTFAHFCQALNDPSLIPLRFIEALSKHLANKHPPFRKTLLQTDIKNVIIQPSVSVGIAEIVKGIEIHKIQIGNTPVREAFDRLVRKPLEQLYNEDPTEKILILVDSLDEAQTINLDENILSLIADITDDKADLTKNVRFLLTSRPDPRVTRKIGKSSLNLIEDTPAEIDDLYDYSYLRLDVLKEPSRKDLAIQIAKAAEGNFLYTRYLLDDLIPTIESEQDLKNIVLPKGLDEIYSRFIKREITRKEERWEEYFRPLLGVISIAHDEGWTREQLAKIIGMKQSKTDDVLRACKQYLSGIYPEGPFRIYHQSFREFLLNNSEYSVYPVEAHSQIANFYLNNFTDNWSDCDEYGLNHVVFHVLNTQFNTFQLKGALKKIFTLPFMAIRAEQAGWHMPIVEDLQMVAKYAPNQVANVIKPCLTILFGTHPNSLVKGKLIRLLINLYPKIQREEQWNHQFSGKYEIIKSIITALDHSADDSISILKEMFARVKNVEKRCVIALALGETKSQNAIPILHEALINIEKREEQQISWCAAEALIALNTPNIIDHSIITKLHQDFNKSYLKPGTKQRILYVLGRIGIQLPFEKAVKLTHQGLKLPGTSKIRAIDLIYLLLPKKESEKRKWIEEFEPFLWDKLGFDLKGIEYNKNPKWNDEWTQKRMVTALGRIGSLEAKEHLEHFAQEVETRPKPTTRSLKRKRTNLKKSIQRAIYDLKNRHS